MAHSRAVRNQCDFTALTGWYADLVANAIGPVVSFTSNLSTKTTPIIMVRPSYQKCTSWLIHPTAALLLCQRTTATCNEQPLATSPCSCDVPVLSLRTRPTRPETHTDAPTARTPLATRQDDRQEASRACLSLTVCYIIYEGQVMWEACT